jgi:transcriptional regulator CBF1
LPGLVRISIMAETAEQPTLSAGLAGSPGQKRKRGEQTSPGDRRSKRGAPPAAMAPSADSAYVDSAVEAAQAAVSGVSVADFNALQQAAAAEHSEAANPANASSTAAAALGSMYPTLHVPQSTEETFAAQNPVDDHSDDISILKGDGALPDGLPSVGSLSAPTNGIRTQEPRFQSGPPSGHKPTVGSEEWHKMRKDNHKEG